MGEVYRARDARLGREVALKVLPAAAASDESARRRFEREARAVTALSHPNILAIHDFGSEQQPAYAAMELPEGETLRARGCRAGRCRGARRPRSPGPSPTGWPPRTAGASCTAT
jgi:serine/threonine protein kinase